MCAAWSGGLITRSVVVGKVAGLKWTLWTLILRVRRTQIKCAALVQMENLKVRQQRSPGEEQLQFVIAFHTALILWNVNHPSHQNAGSHISNNLVWQDFCFLFESFLLLYLWVNSGKCTLSHLLFLWWHFFITEDNYSEDGCNPKKLDFCNSFLLHNVCSSLLTPPLLLFMEHYFSLHLSVNRGFNRDFGKKTQSAMPGTPGGSSKVVPIASLNPYQSKWVSFPVHEKFRVNLPCLLCLGH